jgi:DNA repair exonuclease SbcCD ATPase subunit
MKHKILEAILFALPLTLAIPALASPPEDPPAEGDAPAEGATVEISEEEALADDILLIIDLPIAADEARDAGLEEAEIDEAIDAAETAAISPGTMTEVLADEAESIRATGKRKAFGQWVKMQIAEGVRGKELAAKIKERKDELAALTDEQKAEIQAKLEARGKENREQRKQMHAKRKELKDAGKLVVLVGEDRHVVMIAAAAERHAAAKAERKAAKLDKREDKLDKREDKLDALEDKHDGHEGDKADKLDDKLDKIEDKQDKLEDRKDKIEERKDKLEDKKADHKGHNGPKDK